jgi:hypothetical protein
LLLSTYSVPKLPHSNSNFPVFFIIPSLFHQPHLPTPYLPTYTTYTIPIGSVVSSTVLSLHPFSLTKRWLVMARLTLPSLLSPP